MWPKVTTLTGKCDQAPRKCDQTSMVTTCANGHIFRLLGHKTLYQSRSWLVSWFVAICTGVQNLTRRKHSWWPISKNLKSCPCGRKAFHTVRSPKELVYRLRALRHISIANGYLIWWSSLKRIRSASRSAWQGHKHHAFKILFYEHNWFDCKSWEERHLPHSGEWRNN